MKLSRIILAIVIFSSMAIGLSGCDWEGSGSGSGHYSGTPNK